MPKQVVAIIDDNEGIRNALDRLLKVNRYRTELFSSAAEYLVALTKSKAQCLVVDVHLADGSGIELVRLLKAKDVCRPTIFITASTESLHRLEALRLGCVAYLTKPFCARQLLTAIESATSSQPKS